MTMKPTEKKLRLSLITIAALLGYFSIELIFPNTTRETFLFAIVGMILCLGNLYFALRLSRLPAEKRGRVARISMVTAAWMAAMFLFSRIGGLDDPRGYMLFGGLVISWYVVRNLKKTLAPATAAAPAAAPTTAEAVKTQAAKS
ncbi:MAG: hypothetical protein L0099_00230 [Acidobacteria bacterium]|nr:hypothetical protein [Acidobacteriota bacterium]